MITTPVLHLVNEVVDCSISRIIERLVSRLDPDRYVWHVGAMTRMGNMTQRFRDLGMHVVDFKSGEGLALEGSGSTSGEDDSVAGGLVRRIRTYVKRHQIAVVHSHSVRARVVAAAALLGLNDTKHVDTMHHLYHPTDRRWGRLFTFVDRTSLYFPDHLITVSYKMYREVMAMPLVDAKRLTAIQNAIECDLFYKPDLREACREEFGFNLDVPVLGYTGQIRKLKGIDRLLQSFAQVLDRYPDARLMIVGDGEQRRDLEKMAQGLGIADAVTWTGFRQDIPRLLSAMDIFVLPSSNEGLSLSILEAMAAGKAVVVTDVGGAQEIVADQESGLVIPPDSVSALYEAMDSLLADPAERVRMGREARQTTCKRFSVAEMVSAYQEVYENLAFHTHTWLNVPRGS